MRTIFFIIIIIFITYTIYVSINKDNKKDKIQFDNVSGLPEINQSLNKDVIFFLRRGDCSWIIDADVNKINEITNLINGYTGVNWVSKYKSNITGSWRRKFKFEINKTFCKNKTVAELNKLISILKAIENPKI